MISGEDVITGCEQGDNDIYVALNSWINDLTFKLPILPSNKNGIEL